MNIASNIGGNWRLDDQNFFPISVNIYAERDSLREKVYAFLKEIDLGLSGIEVEIVQDNNPQTDTKREGYRVWGIHKIDSEKTIQRIPFNLESSDTQAVFSYLVCCSLL